MCAEGVRYDYSCIMPSSACSDEQHLAALYDYAGAVYGEEGKVKYDNVLTPQEMAYVKKKFGEIDAFSSATSYLKWARKHVLSSEVVDPACDPDIFTFERIWNLDLGVAVNMGTVHGCAELIGDIYGISGTELHVAAHPSSWTFMLEGSEGGSSSKGDMTRDIAFFRRIAKELNIPVESPVTPVYSDEVLQGVKEKYGISREVVALQFGVDTLNQVAKYGELTNENLGPLIAAISREMAKLFRVDEGELKRIFAGNISKGLTNGLSLDMWLNALEGLALQVINKVLAVSNEVSLTAARGALKKYPERSNALFLVGAGHTELTEALYDEENVFLKMIKVGFELMLNSKVIEVSSPL